MKKLLLFIFFSCFFNVTGQSSGNFVLNWSDKLDYSSESIQRKIPQFQLQNFYFDDVAGTIYLTLNIPVSFEADTNVTLSNIIYETVAVSQLGDLPVQSLSSSLNAKVTNSKSRNELSAILTLIPIIKDETGIKRLKSFTYTLLPKNSSISDANFRSKTGRGVTTIYNSVLSNGDWYTFYVEKSGVYKLSKSFLQNLGLDVNVDPRKIKIYGNGGRMLPLLNSV
ncbi:MAG TPA: peptidase C25, partial [Flavobacterium sp.]